MQFKNDLLLRTLQGEDTDRKPVWLMRQAGRILPEYRQIREMVKNFKEMIKNPDLAAEVTLQPVDLLGVDAAIIFSDILVIPEAMGLPYEMVEAKGPYFPKTVRTEKDLQLLKIAEAETDLGYVLEAIRVTKKALNHRVPLIGFAGAPWTIFAYMTEGKGSKTFSVAKSLLYQNPQFAHKLLEKITQSTIHYLKAQIKAGADVVQIFDSWAGILTLEAYEQFSLPYIEQICKAISEVPVVVFAKGAFFARLAMGKLPCACIGLDWTMNPITSRQLIGEQKVLQGNLDPCVLYADFNTIRKETNQMLVDFGKKHIANLGHGVYPDIEADKVRCFIDTVKEFSFVDAK